MNNLTLYLLLATDQAAKSKSAESCDSQALSESAVRKCNAVSKPGVYHPREHRPRPLCQASYRPVNRARTENPATQAWIFSASVVANAVGFLALASGMMLLLRVAQVMLA